MALRKKTHSMFFKICLFHKLSSLDAQSLAVGSLIVSIYLSVTILIIINDIMEIV